MMDRELCYFIPPSIAVDWGNESRSLKILRYGRWSLQTVPQGRKGECGAKVSADLILQLDYDVTLLLRRYPANPNVFFILVSYSRSTGGSKNVRRMYSRAAESALDDTNYWIRLRYDPALTATMRSYAREANTSPLPALFLADTDLQP